MTKQIWHFHKVMPLNRLVFSNLELVSISKEKLVLLGWIERYTKPTKLTNKADAKIIKDGHNI